MAFPKTRKALENSGYSFSHTKICPSCNVTIEMFNTPAGRQMPLDFKTTETGEEVCEPHFATCKNPAQYSSRLRKKKEEQEAKDAGPGPILP